MEATQNHPCGRFGEEAAHFVERVQRTPVVASSNDEIAFDPFRYFTRRSEVDTDWFLDKKWNPRMNKRAFDRTVFSRWNCYQDGIGPPLGDKGVKIGEGRAAKLVRSYPRPLKPPRQVGDDLHIGVRLRNDG